MPQRVRETARAAAEAAAVSAARIDLQPYENSGLYLTERTRRHREVQTRIGEPRPARGRQVTLPHEVLVVIHPGSQVEGWKRFYRGSPEMNRCLSRGLAKNITITEFDSVHISSLITLSFVFVYDSDNISTLEINRSLLIRNHSTIDVKLVIKLGGNSFSCTFFTFHSFRESSRSGIVISSV